LENNGPKQINGLLSAESVTKYVIRPKPTHMIA